MVRNLCLLKIVYRYLWLPYFVHDQYIFGTLKIKYDRASVRPSFSPKYCCRFEEQAVKLLVFDVP